MSGRAGMTLMEVLIASAISVIVVVGITTLDVTRSRLQEDARQQSGLLTPEHGRVALAVIHLAKRMERADLVELSDPALPRFRFPDLSACAGPPLPACFDNPANYTWDMYRVNAGDLQVAANDGGVCTGWTTLASQVTGLTVQFQNAEPAAPPGGDPLVSGAADNNMIQFSIEWTDPATGRTHEFTGQAAIRASSYSDITTGMANSAAVSPPPGAC